MTGDDLRLDIAAEPSWGPKLGSKAIAVAADDGAVILTVTAQWQYQRDEAECLTASVPGVSGIGNDITLTSPRDGRDIRNAIGDAFRRSARVGADDLSVDAHCYGTVTAAEAVSSWAEHDEAVAAAWSASGVTEADDRIVVEY
ncbi:MAG TPA: BON domain-containing protein [Streptosporangiaceae bacterium]|nr:BON domain-containing protein [Streptosporangiaceae bacterium]